MRHINHRQPIVNLSNEGYFLIHLIDYLQNTDIIPGSVFDILPANADLRNVCSNVINIHYVEDAITHCIQEDPNNRIFDILLLVKNVKIQSNGKTAYFYERKGILITEVGECQDVPYQNTPVLKVICCDDNKGKYLMYSYIQAMLYKYLNSAQRRLRYHYSTGLLELAGNYENIRGLCLYNKFGFRENINLQSIDCLNQNYHNNGLLLPMSVDITTLTYDIVDDVVENNRVVGDEPLCDEKFKTNERMQRNEIIRRKNVFKNGPDMIDFIKSKNRSRTVLNNLNNGSMIYNNNIRSRKDNNFVTQSLLAERAFLRNKLLQLKINKTPRNNKKNNQHMNEKLSNSSTMTNISSNNNNSLNNYIGKNESVPLKTPRKTPRKKPRKTPRKKPKKQKNKTKTNKNNNYYNYNYNTNTNTNKNNSNNNSNNN